MSKMITQQCNGVSPLMLWHTVCSLRAHNYGMLSEAGAVYKATADVRVRARGGGLMKRQ